MRTVAISDTHFGAWTGDDILRHRFAIDMLAPHIAEADELVLLGDIFDWLFSTVENSVKAAAAFFEMVNEQLAGGRVVFVAGNHDHHTVWRRREAVLEEHLATGRSAEEIRAETVGHLYFIEYLKRIMPSCDVHTAYPTYRVGDALLSHGHYLDAHVEGALSARMLRRLEWALSGESPAERRAAPLTISDYEAVITPLQEMLYQIAQQPEGIAVQQSVFEQLQAIGKFMRVMGTAARTARRAGRLLRKRLVRLVEDIQAVLERRARTGRPARDEELREIGLNLATLGQDLHLGADPSARGRGAYGPGHRHDFPLASVVLPTEPTSTQMNAFADVVGKLGWGEQSRKLVFAHTHQPLDGVFSSGDSDVKYWNTGSWIYAPPRGRSDTYRRYAWPGTMVVIDSEREEPYLVRVLEGLSRAELERRLYPSREAMAGDHTSPGAKREFGERLFRDEAAGAPDSGGSGDSGS